MMKIDVEKWNKDRVQVEAEIKALKHLIRKEPRVLKFWAVEDGAYTTYEVTQPHGTDKDFSDLACLRQKATSLYQIRAHLRGKQHRLKEVVYRSRPGGDTKEVLALSKEQEAEQIGYLIEDYALCEEAPEAATI